MAYILDNRVQQTSTTSGTADFTLNGGTVSAGFRAFTDAPNLSDGDTVPYVAVNGTEWEVGVGTWTASTQVLARTTVEDNSAGTTAKVNFSATPVVDLTLSRGAYDRKLDTTDFFESATLSGTITPNTMTWSEVSRRRPFELVAEKLKTLDINFEIDWGFTSSGTGAVALTYPNSSLQMTQTSGSPYQVILLPERLETNHYAIEADVLSTSDTGTYNIVVLGMAADSSNSVEIEFDVQNNEIRLVEVNAGVFNTIDSDSTITTNAPFRLACTLHGNDAAGWLDRGNGWELIVSGTLSTASRDFITTATHLSYKPMIGISTNGVSANVVFDSVRAGPFGQTGLRDMNMVRYEDLTPIQIGSKYFITMTASGATDVASHWAMYTYDINTRAVEKVGQFVFEVSTSTYARLAGCIVYDRNAKHFKLLVSSWGEPSGPTKLSYLETTEWLLEGTHRLSGLTDLTVPLGTSGQGLYDPEIYWDGTEWTMAYTITDDITFATDVYHTAAATSSNFTTWTLVAEASSDQGYEGTKMIKISDEVFIFASSRTDHKVYDLDMNLEGTNTTPLTVGAGASPPQTLVMPINKGGETHFEMLQFDGTKVTGATDLFTWGTLHVQLASQTQTGDEHNPRQFIAFP